MKTRRLLSTTSIFSALFLLGNTAAIGQVLNQEIRDNTHIKLLSDIDGNNNGGLTLTTGGDTILTVTDSGHLYVYGPIYDARSNDDTVNIGEDLSVSGNISTNDNIFVGGFIRDPNEGGTVQIADPLLVSGATGSEISLNVVGQTTLDATTIAGTTSISGATSINTTGTDATSIGNASSTTGIVGTTSITGATTVTGITSINTTGTAATSIGNVTPGTVVTVAGGSSNISLRNGATEINADSGDANTTIGVSGNSTSIQSTNVVVGNTTAANTITMGNANSGTGITAAAGTSRMSLANGTTSINTTSGAANTTIGVAANTTSILSTNVVVGNATTSSSISVGTGSAANTITMGNVATATAITAAAGNTAMAMRNGSITNTVTASAGVSAETVVANNGSTRWVADGNGKLTEVAGSDTTSGTTAAMVVTNSAGNTHGVVVQETKTTLSGGTNSSSLTLDERGATFSDSATGYPIQVHGVADGTAPFDAVNVRQLYSGLASVLAAAPDLRLEPGTSGFGIGLGSYGGYQAIGVGFGHMYDNGLVLTGSISRGEYSETAARASLSWNW
jgi:hypothetical protein